MYAEGLYWNQVDFIKEINWAEHEYMNGSIADVFVNIRIRRHHTYPCGWLGADAVS